MKTSADAPGMELEVFGVIAAGGTGSRLGPLTAGLNKHLLPVFDKPMIFYPLVTLMAAGVRDIVIVTGPQDIAQFRRLLGDGASLGVSITYAQQEHAKGVAHVLQSASDAIHGEQFAFILGDNFFYGPGLGRKLSVIRPTQGGHIFASQVVNPHDYGVVVLDKDGVAIDIEEKPPHPRSDLAIPGLYFYGADVWDLLDELEPSPRGEVEISDLNRALLKLNRLTVEVLPRGTVWLDAGTVDALEEASEFVSVVQKRQGLLIGCPEEIALINSWLTVAEVASRAETWAPSPYGAYLRRLLASGSA
jgi:glucose-1-phosphate thymidylyltransferase